MQCNSKLVLEIVRKLQLISLGPQVLKELHVATVEVEVHFDGSGETMAHKS